MSAEFSFMASRVFSSVRVSVPSLTGRFRTRFGFSPPYTLFPATSRTFSKALGATSLAISSSFLPMISTATGPATATTQNPVMAARDDDRAMAARVVAPPRGGPAAIAAREGGGAPPSQVLLAAPNHSDQLFLVCAVAAA